MKRLLSLLACVTLFSSVGCCCLNSRINECDPLASDLAGGGGCLAKFARSHGAKKCKCHHCMGYGGMYADPMYGLPYGMDGCCGGGHGMAMGGFPEASGGCGCAGGGANYPSVPPAPPAQYAPQGSPTPAPSPEPAPAPADNGVPAPPESAAPMTYQPAPAQPGVQNVSMEEFQRLPGTIISGPTTTPVATPVPGPSSAVVPRMNYPTAVNPGVHPANWQPARVQ